MTELKSGYSYLIKRSGSNMVSKITLHAITKTCFKIQFEKGEPYYIEKSVFNTEYRIVEEMEQSTFFDLLGKIYI